MRANVQAANPNATIVEAASPIDDVRASAAYRRAMVHNLTLRGLREVWQQLSAAQGRAA